jgi:hypothetical protein
MNTVASFRVLLFAGLVGLAWLTLTAAPASATSALYLSDIEQAAESTAVVIARVGAARQAVHPKWNRPLTLTSIEVEEVLVGAAPASLSIEQLGGVLDGKVHYIPGDAVLKQGERCLLFLRNVEGGWFLTAMKQSRYQLLEGKRGTFVKRDLSEGLFVNTPNGLRPFAPPRNSPVQLLSDLRDKFRRAFGGNGGRR